jgi:hypothetical protein
MSGYIRNFRVTRHISDELLGLVAAPGGSGSPMVGRVTRRPKWSVGGTKPACPARHVA